VKRRLATGEVVTYWYHRATGTRLRRDPETAEGHLEIAALDSRAKAVSAVSGHQTGSFAALWTAYTDSPEWRGLKPRTRSDYQKVRDWLGAAADRAIVKLMTSAQILKLRDKGEKDQGRRFGNYVLQVVRLVLDWGRLRGWRADNPAMGLKQIRKPTGERVVNRAWSISEVRAFATAAPPQLLLPFMLGLFAGMRQGDALRVTWSAYNGAMLTWIAGKNGEECFAPVTGQFKAVLDSAKAARGRSLQIAVASHGDPWTESGFRASFFKLVKRLEKEGLLMPGCTFHGLRHTVGTFARDGGESNFRVSAAIGDRTTAMADVYGRDAERQGAQTEVLADVQKRFANIDWKTGMENGPAPGKSKRR
jgi:integrase